METMAASYSTQSQNNGWNANANSTGVVAASASIIVGGALLYTYMKEERAVCKKKSGPNKEPGSVIANLPTYTADEVKKHDNAQSGIWVRDKYDTSVINL